MRNGAPPRRCTISSSRSGTAPGGDGRVRAFVTAGGQLPAVAAHETEDHVLVGLQQVGHGAVADDESGAIAGIAGLGPAVVSPARFRQWRAGTLAGTLATGTTTGRCQAETMDEVASAGRPYQLAAAAPVFRGIVVRGASERGLAEEAPQAYKDVTQVVEAAEGAGAMPEGGPG
jgi:hypothetical protein